MLLLLLLLLSPFFISSAPFNNAQPQSLVAVVFPTNGDLSPNPVPVVTANGDPSPNLVPVVYPLNGGPSPSPPPPPPPSPPHPPPPSSVAVVASFASPSPTKKKGESKELDEFYVDQVLGMPTKFSYKDLRAMTCNFNDELGKMRIWLKLRQWAAFTMSIWTKAKLMKGTLGYLALEWMNSVITEKVDIYSFGVVALEMLCGRKNLDRSQLEEDMHLLSLFKRKAEEEQLMDIVDKYNDDMQIQREEVVKMMRVAMWRLQSDFSRRPSMSVVVKVLEGSVEVENNLDYNFTTLVVRRAIRVAGNQEDAIGAAASPLFPSVLSGPR
ncbi:hypothetical protein TEA_015733 [Camellia sinensis var. sinensis]|uniref:Serine-threonine/tyrosine-protein kinase catalytic domain-containing protein n=1 Tax=Camellia sinensis var. sinensis TaxID=542762 RepID=A0A4S4EK27_CAMSN|nr:hypothetical protein TEA_015733 [Camellia sinensis var. sinensis]